MALDIPNGGVFVAALSLPGDATSAASWGTLTPAYDHLLTETPGTQDVFSGVSAGPLTPGGNQQIDISPAGSATTSARSRLPDLLGRAKGMGVSSLTYIGFWPPLPEAVFRHSEFHQAVVF